VNRTARRGLLFALPALWAAAALYIDVRAAWLRLPLILAYLLATGWILARIRRPAQAAGLCLAAFGGVLLWWLSLKPSTEGPWRADTERLARAEIAGGRATIHNLRNCQYHSEREFTNCWEDREVSLADIRALDLIFVNWGIRWTDHVIASFEFAGGDHIAFSVEPRFRVGQTYAALPAFFRQYELIFVAADERDVIRLRTNYRRGESCFLYRSVIDAAEAREIFLSFLDYLNRLRDHAEWYNALTRNCSTTMSRRILGGAGGWTAAWNLGLDEVLYRRGRLVTDGLSFAELKRRAYINNAARAAGSGADFSQLIRVGRVGPMQDPQPKWRP